ncbi:hypothetical protein TNCV_1987651 [Trichonephila clavipes]|nr:hypothetical protein TNCV_1987651 [Trichonephila clavipes]
MGKNNKTTCYEWVNINVSLFSPRAFGDGPRNFELLSRDEDDPSSPKFHVTPMGGRLIFDRFNVHRLPTRRVFNGTRLELVTSQPRSDTLTTGLLRTRRRNVKENNKSLMNLLLFEN